MSRNVLQPGVVPGTSVETREQVETILSSVNTSHEVLTAYRTVANLVGIDSNGVTWGSHCSYYTVACNYLLIFVSLFSIVNIETVYASAMFVFWDFENKHML